MEFQHLTEHYEGLLRSGSAWLGDGLAWTAVLPVDGSLPLEETVSRLVDGEGPPLVEMDGEDAYEEGGVWLEQVGNATMIVQTFGKNYVWDEEVLGRLTVNARVWHLAWEITGSSRLIYAAYGRVLAVVPHLEPVNVMGEDPAAIEAELAALAQVVDAPWLASKATAMAIVEARTGARLDVDWFERPHPAAVIDEPE
ncbi:hypothetical protein GCM10009555_029510 [Acrocarpospora macrocephala]|uniref:Uncharacterized protein n=1 Tax=Acrocarpospora macrocephala TaxID=150177 RepID=A0A5M3WSJ4_9ACTN|nr:hypothetical protein [Acrocarpospora macrocephala]GES11142.1 hypothetical protein Amac_047390 [Acrocarpospora macrocephala]